LSVETTWTIKRLLGWTTEFFQSKQLEPARLSAEILLAEALGCQRIDLYTRFDMVPGATALSRYRDWVKRHVAGEPVAYLVGHREFYSLRFEVNPDVLIPRPETEHLVMQVLEVAPALGNRPLIVDVGTGSGAIAITLAKQLPQSRIFATDISAAAVSVAQRNAVAHRVEGQVEFHVGHLLAPLPADLQPHVIVSNPPYIGTGEVDTVAPSVRDYEPNIALFAGHLGTDVIAPLIRSSADRLAPGGFLILETSPLIFEECLELVKAAAVFDGPKTIKDYAGHRRVIQACKETDFAS